MDTDTLHELSFMFKGWAHDSRTRKNDEGSGALGNVLLDVKMSERTTIRIGGIAPILIEPAGVSSLVFALRTLSHICPVFVAGGGSNLIVCDNGFDTPVISTRALCSAPVSTSTTVSCAAGCNMSSLVDYCIAHGLSGMEQFAGLPGTVGGAVYMNARCFEREISDALVCADYVNFDTQDSGSTPAILVQHYDMNKADWAYKVSPFQGKKRIITSATFSVRALDKKDIEDKCKAYIEERRQKGHFRAPSAGSIFRNNRAFGSPSGVLIDEAHLKGKTIGGAQIAPWHGNIIINTGNATASDVVALVRLAHDTVKERTGYDMQSEVVFCGAQV